jgi:hypothetical protein
LGLDHDLIFAHTATTIFADGGITQSSSGL